MADIRGAISTTEVPGASAPAQPGSSHAVERHEWMQEVRQEMRHKGQEVAAECYQHGREPVLAWQQQREHQVRLKLIQSLLVVAGLGLLCGLLRQR